MGRRFGFQKQDHSELDSIHHLHPVWRVSGNPGGVWCFRATSASSFFGIEFIFTILFALNMIGGGDVKLIAAISFWAGLAYVAEFLVIMALSGGVLALFYFLKNHNRVDPEVKPEVIINKSSESSATMTFGENKQTIKGTHIPYGLAISVAGLFVVVKLFVNFLPA